MDANRLRRIRASEEAAEWWVTLQGGNLSRAQREEYVDWLRESPLHIAELMRITQVQGALEKFSSWDQIVMESTDVDRTLVDLHPVVPIAPPAPLKAPRFRLRFVTAIAAAAVCATIFALWVRSPSTERVLQTQRGDRYEVALDDGSVIMVGPQTRIRIRFDGRARAVFLDRGLALFRVAKDEHRPFIVHFDTTSVRAVGTQFGIERRSTGALVTVVEGRVSVRTELAQTEASGNGTTNRLPAGRTGASTAAGEVLLGADEQLKVARFSELQQVRRVDSGRELAWAKGRLVFENEPVSAVIERFNRYNQIQLKVQDADIARRLVSGTFDAIDPDAFVAFLVATIPVRIVRVPGSIVILGDTAQSR